MKLRTRLIVALAATGALATALTGCHSTANDCRADAPAATAQTAIVVIPHIVPHITVPHVTVPRVTPRIPAPRPAPAPKAPSTGTTPKFIPAPVVPHVNTCKKDGQK